MSHLTKIAGVPDRAEIIPGMAHYAGSGPPGKTCGDCAHRGYYRESGKWDASLRREVFRSYRVTSCAKFKALTGHHGSPVAAANRACKYFEPAEGNS